MSNKFRRRGKVQPPPPVCHHTPPPITGGTTPGPPGFCDGSIPVPDTLASTLFVTLPPSLGGGVIVLPGPMIGGGAGPIWTQNAGSGPYFFTWQFSYVCSTQTYQRQGVALVGGAFAATFEDPVLGIPYDAGSILTVPNSSVPQTSGAAGWLFVFGVQA